MSPTTDSGFSELIRAALADDLEHTTARIAGLEHALSDFKEASREGSSEDEHDEDSASLAVERSQTITLLEGAREHAEEISAALGRLDAGTYGVCERCGKEIAPARLEARPVARLCIECASAEHHGA